MVQMPSEPNQYPAFCSVRYSRSLEEGSFRGRPADFLTCLLFGMAVLLVRGLLAASERLSGARL